MFDRDPLRALTILLLPPPTAFQACLKEFSMRAYVRAMGGPSLQSFLRARTGPWVCITQPRLLLHNATDWVA